MSNDFPCMLYKAPGEHEIHGGKFDYLIVNDEEEGIEALRSGWHLTTDEAKFAHEQSKLDDSDKPVPAPAPVAESEQAPAIPEQPAEAEQAPADTDPPTRDELKQKATELGLEFPANIPTDKLTALIEEAVKASE